MMRSSFLAFLLLAGCGSLEPVTPRPYMPDAECRAEAEATPEVRNVGREANLDNPANLRRVTSDRNQALGREYDACLRRRGLPMPGGVEPVRRID